MQLDLATLQLVVNVVMITGVTSLAVICHLLKRDNQKLTNELNVRCQQVPRITFQAAPKAFMPEQDSQPEQECVAALHSLPIKHPDIRRYVAQRAHGWAVPN
jgi:hypothetical protein